MFETPHVFVGAAIATKIANPALSIPLALASHFILDQVPHWNPHTFTETMKNGGPKKNTLIAIGVDIAVSAVVLLYFTSSAMPDTNLAFNIFACSIASILPDISKYPYFLIKKTRKGLYDKWVRFERSLQVETDNVLWGLLTQFAVSLAALWWIFA